MEKSLINTSVLPSIPDENLIIRKHRCMGTFEFNPDDILLREVEASGSYLKDTLAYESLLNANVLDYLLLHTELIPETWKEKSILFLGTIYFNKLGGNECVRILYYRDSKIYGGWTGIDCIFGPGHQVAILKCPGI